MLVDAEFEKILTSPILDIAARFWEKERYDAFRVCYRSMRLIDDFVDCRKATGVAPTKAEIIESRKLIQDWSEKIANGTDSEANGDLSRTIKQFCVPIWPWQRLAQAMIYDLDHNGFVSIRSFLRYCEGAAIAPAAVFVHLCGVKKQGSKYQQPEFDIRRAARPLALFSYLVHILRDFEKDQLNNLNYFSDELLAKNNISKEELKNYAVSQVTDQKLRALFSDYKKIAEFYQERARRTFKHLLPQLESRYQLSLQIIYALYSHIFEKIDPENGGFSEEKLILSPAEVQKRIDLTVSTFQPVK